MDHSLFRLEVSCPYFGFLSSTYRVRVAGKLCGDGKPDGTPADDCESGIRHSGSLHDVR